MEFDMESDKLRCKKVGRNRGGAQNSEKILESFLENIILKTQHFKIQKIILKFKFDHQFYSFLPERNKASQSHIHPFPFSQKLDSRNGPFYHILFRQNV